MSRIDQTNRRICSSCMPLERMLVIVIIKLIDLRIDDAAAKCRDKIARSIDGPL